MKLLDQAIEYYNLDQHRDAERCFREAVLKGEKISKHIVDLWIYSQGERICDDAMTVLQANPDSSAAYEMLTIAYLKNGESDKATSVVNEAVSKFGECETTRIRFIRYRVTTALRSTSCKFVDWQQFMNDLTELWQSNLIHNGERKGKEAIDRQDTLVQDLFRLECAEGIEAILEFASSIENSHPHYANALCAHDKAIRFFMKSG